MDLLKQIKASNWDDALKRLNDCSEETRTHFAMLILQLADCYGKDCKSKAVVLIDRGDDRMALFSAGADEMDAATMVRAAAEVLVDVITADAPPREMFN